MLNLIKQKMKEITNFYKSYKLLVKQINNIIIDLKCEQDNSSNSFFIDLEKFAQIHINSKLTKKGKIVPINKENSTEIYKNILKIYQNKYEIFLVILEGFCIDLLNNDLSKPENEIQRLIHKYYFENLDFYKLSEIIGMVRINLNRHILTDIEKFSQNNLIE